MKQVLAVTMQEYGGPDVLRLGPRPAPELRPGEARIQVLAAAVNHSDLRIRCGDWPVRRDPAFPYVPGLEAVGEVVEVAESADAGWLRVGDRVWTMMQGLGGVRAERDGGYAEQIVVATDALAPLPEKLDPVDAAAIGLAGVTATGGLRRLLHGARGDPVAPSTVPGLAGLAGRPITVSGAAGGVGSLAVALAAAAGAEVTAMVGRADHADYVRALGAARVVVGRTPPLELAPASQAGVLDTVAGPLFPVLVDALGPDGRYCMVGAVGGSSVTFDVWALERRVLTTYSTEDLDGETLRAATADIVSALARDDAPYPERTVLPLGEAAEAHRRLEAHQITGRVVLVP